MSAETVLVVIAVLSVLNTLNAYRPLRRTVLHAPAWAASWLTSELPVLTLVTQAAVAVVAQWRDAMTPLAWVLFGLSWAGLVGLHVAGRRAEPVLEQALVEALGPEYRDRSVQPQHPGPGVQPSRQPSGLRVLSVRRRYLCAEDLSYGDAGQANLLDVWRRKDLSPDVRAPVVIQIPGGAWVIGKKTGQAYPLLAHLVDRGWVVVCINYRLAPKSLFPAMAQDVLRAVAWVKQHITEYGGDPAFVALTGGSAGGHLSTLAALVANEPYYQPGLEDVDTRVQAVVPFYGVYDWTNRDLMSHPQLLPHLERKVVKASLADDRAPFEAGSPRSHLRPDAPPFFVVHGRNDTLVPVSQCRPFVHELRAVSRSPVAYAELPLTQHAFDVFGSPRANAAARAVTRFLGVVYGDHLRAASESTSASERPGA